MLTEEKRKYRLKYYARNKSEVCAQARQSYKEDKSRFVRASKKWRQKNVEKLRGFQLKWQNGATDEEVQQFLDDCEKQQGKCRVCCELSIIKDKSRLCYDHNHTTGHYRGAICHKCNAALGLLGEDPHIVQRLLAYIRGDI